MFSRESINDSTDNKWFNIFFILGITILDFVKELNCGYYLCGEVIVDRKKIARRYLTSTRMYFDLLAFVSLLADVIQVDWANVYVV